MRAVSSADDADGDATRVVAVDEGAWTLLGDAGADADAAFDMLVIACVGIFAFRALPRQ